MIIFMTSPPTPPRAWRTRQYAHRTGPRRTAPALPSAGRCPRRGLGRPRRRGALLFWMRANAVTNLKASSHTGALAKGGEGDKERRSLSLSRMATTASITIKSNYHIAQGCWVWRCHKRMEDLIKEDAFNAFIAKNIKETGRGRAY